MKKLLIVLVFFISVQPAHSQVLITLLFGDILNSDWLEFGLNGGFNFSKITGLESPAYFSDWNLGFYFDIATVKTHPTPWHISTGVLVKSRQGAGNLTEQDILNLDGTLYTANKPNYEQKINYFLVPILAKYYFNPHWYVELGPHFGLRYKAYVEFTSKDKGRDARIRDFNKHLFTRIDAGAMAGAGYRLKGRTGWTLGIKYYYGLSYVIKNQPDTHNRSIFLSVHIPIGRGEEAQKKQAEKRKKKADKKAGR